MIWSELRWCKKITAIPRSRSNLNLVQAWSTLVKRALKVFTINAVICLLSDFVKQTFLLINAGRESTTGSLGSLSPIPYPVRFMDFFYILHSRTTHSCRAVTLALARLSCCYHPRYSIASHHGVNFCQNLRWLSRGAPWTSAAHGSRLIQGTGKTPDFFKIWKIFCRHLVMQNDNVEFSGESGFL